MRTGVSCPSLEIRPVTDATPNNAGKSCFNDYANGLITEREYRRYILAA